MASFPEGPLRTITAAFVDINGDPIDYSTVQLSYSVQRSGVWPVTVIYSDASPGPGVIVRASQGSYSIQLATLGVSGKWTFEWQGLDASSDIQAQQKGAFTIVPKDSGLF